MKEIKKNSSRVVYYEYDYRGFLTKEIRPNYFEANYTYDYNGNITKKEIIRDYGETEIIDYDYKSLYPSVIESINDVSITYDSGNINPLSYGDISYTWEGKKLKSYKIGEEEYFYVYNDKGLRKIKHTLDSEIHFYYEGDKLIKEEIIKDNEYTYRYYYYDESGILYGIKYEDELYYYIRNIFGDILGLVDTSGNVVVEYSYSAWGEVLGYSGTLASTLGSDNPFRYKGYYYDDESGYYYCINRYYDPIISRWISMDDVSYLDIESISGTNLFMYCNNNPIMYKDSSGHYPEWIGILGSTTENILNFAETSLNTVLMPKSLTMQQAKVLARKGGYLYSARQLIRDREDDIARTLKLSKNISRAANVIGGALFVMDVATTWYTNYNSGSDTWVTDSLTDTLIDGFIFAVGFIPGWGWIASLGLAGIKYLIEENTTWIEDAKKVVAEEPIVKGLLFGFPFVFIGEN